MSTPDPRPGLVPVIRVPPRLPDAATQLAARRAIDPLDVPPPATTLTLGRLLGRLLARVTYGVADLVRPGDSR